VEVEEFMKWFSRGSVLALYLGALLMAAGCSENNEKSANITGKAPAAPVSYTDQNKGGKTSAPSNYPGSTQKK